MEAGSRYYEQLAESWRLMDPEERARIVADAVSRGGSVNQYGQLVFPYIIAGRDKHGRPAITLLPRVHRADARRGSREAQAYCEVAGIPWELGDAEFARFERQWLDERRGGPAPHLVQSWHGDPAGELREEERKLRVERERERARQGRLPYKD